MSNSNHGSAKGFFAGLLIGGLIGAGLALLWTPQSGQSMRRLLRDQAREVADTLSSFVEDAGDLLERAGASIPSFGDKEAKVRQRIEELRNELRLLQESAHKA